MRIHLDSLSQTSEHASFLGAEQRTRIELIFSNVIKITLTQTTGEGFQQSCCAKHLIAKPETVANPRLPAHRHSLLSLPPALLLLY